MSVSPPEILDSARMIQGAGGEVNVRNAISRAYYAAYHMTRQIFPPSPENQAASGAGVHKAYIDHLQEAEQGSLKRRVGVALNAMKGKRTKADYHLADDIRPFEAAMQISKAEQLFCDLDKFDLAQAQSAHDETLKENPTESSSQCEKATLTKPILKRIL